MLFISSLPTALNKYDPAPLYKIERHHEIEIKKEELFFSINQDYHPSKNDSIAKTENMHRSIDETNQHQRYTPYYHVVSRCVYRSFLCGTDLTTGKNYEHRRSWIENCIRIPSSIFDIDICSYAVMSNPLHIVLKLGSEQADEWTTDKGIERWTSLYKGPRLVQRLIERDTLDKAEQDAADLCIAEYRKRLKDLSWFMTHRDVLMSREHGCT